MSQTEIEMAAYELGRIEGYNTAVVSMDQFYSENWSIVLFKHLYPLRTAWNNGRIAGVKQMLAEREAEQ